MESWLTVRPCFSEWEAGGARLRRAVGWLDGVSPHPEGRDPLLPWEGEAPAEPRWVKHLQQGGSPGGSPSRRRRI